MQSHLGRLTVDTNAARSHHTRAISEPSIDRSPYEEPVLVPSNGNLLRPRSTSNYAAAAAAAAAAAGSPHLILEGTSPYHLTPSSIAHLSPAAHSILINNHHQEDTRQPQDIPAPYSPVADDFYQSPIFPDPSHKAWSVYQGGSPKHDRPSQADLEFRPRSAVSEPGLDRHYHNEPRSNMSAFEYMFPAGVGHFSQGPHYETVLQSSFQDYNSIPVPDVPHLDHAPRSSIETPDPRYYNRQMTASPAQSLPSPHGSPVDHEMMRQRRQYHQSRRIAKSQSRARSQGSPSSSYFPDPARSRDVGLGIHMSPEPGMTPPPSSGHYPHSGMQPLMEGYHHDDRASTPTHPAYLDHYAHSPTEHGSFEMPMSMTMPTSHPIYQPSPLPSMSGLVDVGTPERQHPHSSHGTPTGSPGVQDHVRVLGSRPKPQCWDHGCNGRQFSTFSNLLRHQREKSGTSTKSYCPRCGAEFTRTTARNGHMAHEKCKSRRSS